MAERAAGIVERSSRRRPHPGSESHGRTRVARVSGHGEPVSEVLRLRRPADVRSTLRSGARAGGAGVVVHARRREEGGASRVTVVAGRRLGKAVTRNRAKRRLRAAVADAAPAPGFDIVVVARPEALTADYATLRRTVAAAVARVMARAGRSR